MTHFLIWGKKKINKVAWREGFIGKPEGTPESPECIFLAELSVDMWIHYTKEFVYEQWNFFSNLCCSVVLLLAIIFRLLPIFWKSRYRKIVLWKIFIMLAVLLLELWFVLNYLFVLINATGWDKRERRIKFDDQNLKIVFNTRLPLR